MAIPNLTRNLEPGMRGEDVKQLQVWLKEQGFFPRETDITGYYGDITKNAVKKWQDSVGISYGQYPGYFGPLSKAKLVELSKQPAPSTPSAGPEYFGYTKEELLRGFKNMGYPDPTIPLESITSGTATGLPPDFNKYVYPEQEQQRQIEETQRQITEKQALLDKVTEAGPGADIDPTTGEITYASTGRDDLDALLVTLQKAIEDITKRGLAINPYIEITPDKVAEFLKQAETEIAPYYTGQLKLAKEGFLRSVGYATEDITRLEQDLERKYGKELRTLGEQAAETGFAYSGIRKEQERELAGETQRRIEQQRRELEFKAGTTARELAQQWGGPTISALTPQMAGAPRVIPGQPGFEKALTSGALYTLSPDIYESLIGEKEKEQKTAARVLAGEYETGFKEEELAKKSRALEI